MMCLKYWKPKQEKKIFHLNNCVQWCRRGMDQELKALYQKPETSYVEEGLEVSKNVK